MLTDVRTIASSAAIAEVQGGVISEFAHNNGLLVNREKTEVVRIAVKKCSNENQEQQTSHYSTQLSPLYPRPSAWVSCGHVLYQPNLALNKTSTEQESNSLPLVLPDVFWVTRIPYQLER